MKVSYDLKVGDRVKWLDPAYQEYDDVNDHLNTLYEVVDIQADEEYPLDDETIITLREVDGVSEVEATIDELYTIDTDLPIIIMGGKDFSELVTETIDNIIKIEKASIEKIVDILKGQEGNRVEFDTDFEPELTVIYDGGNHPEYNSNAFSCVREIFLKNDKVMFDTEDDSEYPLDNAQAAQGGLVAYYIYKHLVSYLEWEKEFDDDAE